MKRLIAALGLAVILPLAAANAAPAPARDPMHGFTRLDLNTDGRITLDEFRAASQRWMERAITRHPDGRLAKASDEQRDTMIVRRFERVDVNKDGVIDAAEWTQRPHHRHGHHRHHDSNT
jgi:Ca2+-binding EF-hand superfamily protein